MEIIDCNEYDLRLNDGTLYRIICESGDMDKLIKLLGDVENIAECEEL